MKKTILHGLLLLGSIPAFSQNLLMNQSNTYQQSFSNVSLSNGGGNSVSVIHIQNNISTYTNTINTSFNGNQLNLDNNVQAFNNVKTTHSNPVNKVGNTSASRNQTRQKSTPIQVGATNNVQLVPVSTTQAPQVKSVQSTGSTQVTANNTTSRSTSGTYSRSVIHKKHPHNFYRQTKTKVKHKHKPRVKKFKYHTSKCPSW